MSIFHLGYTIKLTFTLQRYEKDLKLARKNGIIFAFS